MNYKILLSGILCALISAGMVKAQSSTLKKIEGVVVDQESKVIVSVNIRVQGSDIGSVTDDQGRFFLELPEGEHRLVFSSVGYQTKTLEVLVDAKEVKQISIQMEESVQELSSVVITATRSERQLSDLPVPLTVIPKEQIRNMGSLRLNDVLSEQTGLAVVSDHGTGIQIQGFNPEYTLILVDGEPLIGRTAGTLELNRIAVGNIRQIEIVKGPSSSLYGSEALAGVVNIITENPNGVNGTFSTRYGTNNTIDLSTSGNYARDKFGIYAFVNRYRTDGYDLSPESYGNTVDPFSNSTFNSRFTFSPTAKTKFNVSGRYFIEDQESDTNIGSAAQPDIITGKGEVSDWNINSQLSHRFTKKLKTIFRFYATKYKTESLLRHKSNDEVYDESFFKQTFYRPEVQGEYFLNEKNTLTLGVGRIWESVEATRYEDKKRFNDNYFYFQYEWIPVRKINLIAGGRYDAHSAYSSQFSPKLSIQYDALNWLSIRASSGVGFKAPDFRQLYLNFTNAVAGYSVFGSQEVEAGVKRLQDEGQISELLMDPSSFGDLKAESSIAYNLGFLLRPVSKVSSTINLFRNNINDLIQTQAVARKTNGQSVFSYFNLEDVFTQGVEADISYALSKSLTVALGYQYLITKDKSVVDQLKQGEVFARDPETQATYQVDEKNYGGLFNRSRHMANAKIFYNNEEQGWSATLRTIYRGRYGFGDRNGNAILDADNEYVNGYAILNLSAGKSFGKILSIQAGCDNLFDYTDPQYITALPGRLFWMSASVCLSTKNKN